MVRTDTGSAAPTQAPRFALAWAALTYAVASLALGFPALAGRFLVSAHSDQYIAGYAYRDFAAQALRAGAGFPEWNPYLFGGVPYVAGMAGDIFYPTFLLRMALPTDVAMTWGFILHVFLAGLFTYGFLRAWGLGFHASLVGGMAYMMGGPIASYVSPGHDGKLYVSALFPLALWLIVRGVRDGRAWAWGGLALTIGLAVLSPHPQLLQYMLLASGSFALFLALGPDAKGVRPDRRTVITRLATGSTGERAGARLPPSSSSLAAGGALSGRTGPAEGRCGVPLGFAVGAAPGVILDEGSTGTGSATGMARFKYRSISRSA